MTWEQFIPVEPVPHSYMVGRGGTLLLKKNAYKYKKDVKFYAWRYRPDEPIDGVLDVRITFYILRKPSHKRKPYPNTKPDVDNLSKATLDGLEAAGVIKNDSRIVNLTLLKRWADEYGGRTGSLVTIKKIAD